MVCLYFGLPGCGKTTMLTKIALEYSDLKKYENIYTNVRLSVPNVTYVDNECIGKYDMRNSLILIDEATLFADSRDYKNFSKSMIQFFLEHRHENIDLFLFTQQWDGVDKKIRVITDRVYYIYKPFFFRNLISCCYRIPYGIIIPDPKKSDSEKLGDIVQGYCKPNFLVRLFSPKLFRPLYYKYFDSWELRVERPSLPDKYKKNPATKSWKLRMIFEKTIKPILICAFISACIASLLTLL